jgi:hypothetical protein
MFQMVLTCTEQFQHSRRLLTHVNVSGTQQFREQRGRQIKGEVKVRMALNKSTIVQVGKQHDPTPNLPGRVPFLSAYYVFGSILKCATCSY